MAAVRPKNASSRGATQHEAQSGFHKGGRRTDTAIIFIALILTDCTVHGPVDHEHASHMDAGAKRRKGRCTASATLHGSISKKVYAETAVGQYN